MTDEIKVPYGMWDVNGQWMHNKNLGITEAEQRKRNLANGFVTESDDVFQAVKTLMYRLGDTAGDREVKLVLVKCLDQLAHYELDIDYLNAVVDGSWASADEVIFNCRSKRNNNPLGKAPVPITLETLNEKLDELLRKA